MRRHYLLFNVICLVALPFAAGAAAIKFPTQTFTVPDGFEVELVAGPPLTDRPVSASFDDLGRLYVTDSSGSNEKPDKQLQNPTHRVVRLEDTDGDGKFDKSIVFADKLMFPEGCLWFDGSLYVGAPPSIWKLTDTNGDGVADKREEWFKGGTLTGCANDLHGPYAGPDGFLYWTKGAFKEQTHTLGNGRKFNDSAAHIFRARPDGSELDVVMTGGMDNPVEVAFTPDGEAIFTSTFIDFSQPGFRDGIGHAVYGGVFGKQNDVLEERRVKRASPDLMHPFYQAGNAAECGLCRYESDVFGAGYRDNFFATTFNLHKVTRHIPYPHGATYTSTNSDFLVSDSPDFHPTHVMPDADGSLLVVDTGGWYKLCCPSSQLAKPDVLGAIYRVRRTGAPGVAPADKRSAYAQINIPKLDNGQPTTRLKEAAIKRDAKATPLMLELLLEKAAGADASAESARLVRNAAEGLGRMGHKPAVPLLLRAVGLTTDAILQQSLTFALIEIADPAGTAKGLTSDSVSIRRAALTALDQMDGGGLKPEQVTPLLTSSVPPLRETASWIVSHHAEWGGSLADSFRQRLAAGSPNDAARAELQQQLAQFARDAAIQELMVTTTLDAKLPSAARAVALGAMAQAHLKETPASWIGAVTQVLKANDAALTGPSVATARELSIPKSNATEITAALLLVGGDARHPDDIRLDSLAAVPGGLPIVPPDLFEFVRANLDLAKPVPTRSRAANVLAKARLNPEQLSALTDSIKTASPLEITRLLSAYESSNDEVIGLKLVSALEHAKSLAVLSPATLRPKLTNFPESVRRHGEALLATMNVDTVKQRTHLEELEGQMTGGDVRRGQAVFNSAKAACSSCHAIGYLGGKVGPDLTSIGQARTERDLLESIIYPSASFVRSYEPMIVATKSGDEQSGVVRKDSGEEVVLATGPETEVRIARSEIVDMRPGTVSVMPQGLDEQLTKAELADLLAFLKNTKWGPQ